MQFAYCGNITRYVLKELGQQLWLLPCVIRKQIGIRRRLLLFLAGILMNCIFRMRLQVQIQPF